MSLRTKYLLATALSVLVPLLAYLFMDALLMRGFLLRQQAESIRRQALMVHSSLDACKGECAEFAQGMLNSFAAVEPDVEILLLGQKSEVLAASRPSALGKQWHEPGIDLVLGGQSEFYWNEMEHHGESVLDVTIPWRDKKGQLKGVVHLARSMRVVEEQITGVQLRHTIFVVLVALLVGTILSLMTYRLVIRPLTRLSRELQARQALPDDPGQGARGDEIDHLSQVLRTLVGHLAETAAELESTAAEKGRLLERVEGFNAELENEVARIRRELGAANRELVRSEHLSTIGQLAAGLAHELRNPLFIMRASAEKAARSQPGTGELAQDIIEEVDRVDAIIGRLLELGRPLRIDEGLVDMCQLVDEVVDQMRRGQPTDKDISWKQECMDSGLVVAGDRDLLGQAFSNIVSNALQAIDDQGEIRVRVECTPPWVKVSVKDSGVGIAAEDLDRVFKPFFSRRAGGTGLGLSASEKILSLHRAELEVESEPGQGTLMTVRLPLTSADSCTEADGDGEA